MPTPLIVCGAAGRMGRTLVELIGAIPEAVLAGALEAPGHTAIGQDAGAVAGAGVCGVRVSSDLAALARPETVILDFTHAAAAVDHLRIAVAAGSAVVIGTTGYTAAQQAELDRLAAQARCVIAPNMSVGIAVLQRLVRAAASALSGFDPEIVEVHHRMKIDAPSGTALALAQTVADTTGRTLARDAVYGRQGTVGRRTSAEIGVLAVRGGDVVGDHTVIFAGLGERLELTHRAQSRDCLARGALRAALWLATQPAGRYSMEDVLGQSQPG